MVYNLKVQPSAVTQRILCKLHLLRMSDDLGKVKNHLDEKLEKVRSQPWAQPLSSALETTGKLLGLFEDFVPGGKLIGGALSFGATLLNPAASRFDVKTGLAEVEAGIRIEFKGIHTEMERVFTEVESSNKRVAEAIMKTKDMIVDLNFKVRPDILME